MTNMENTVRPFTAIPIHPLPSHNLEAPLPPGVVECKLGGSGGTTTSFTFNGQTGEVKNANDFTESGRKSTNVRVENPDDPSQHVTFCRADKISLKSTNPVTPRTSSFDPSGGYHGSTVQDDGTSSYSYQYPKDTACTPRDPPKGGKC